jgi:hypothetical protein
MSSQEIMELIGDDSQIFTGQLAGDELIGDGTESIDELSGAASVDGSGAGMYIVTAKGAASFFPAELKAGELFPAYGSEVLTAGDKARKLVLRQAADASGWTLAVSRGEIDVTRLGMRYKKYRLGKYDATGTLNSIFTAGITDSADGLISKTMKTFRKAANGSIEIREIDDGPLYFLGYVRRSAVPGTVEDFVFGQIYLHNMTFGGQADAAQSYDSAFRLTGLDPVFYSIEIPLTA